MSFSAIPRWIAAATIVLLGILSVQRLRIEYLPRTVSPVAFLILRLPESTTTEDVSRRWIAPIESRIRAAGGIRGVRGEVSATGAVLEIHFIARTDLGRKTARLLTELSDIREQLPEGSVLQVISGNDAGDEPAAILAVHGADAQLRSESLEEELRQIRGVRDVELYGTVRREIAVRLLSDSDALASEVRSAIRGSIANERLGTTVIGSRASQVESVSGTPRLDRLPIRVGRSVSPLGDLARIEIDDDERSTLARYQGQPALMAVLYADSDVAPLALDATVRREIDRINARDRGRVELAVVRSAAEPLRRLLRGLALGFAIALVAAAAAGWLLGRARGAVRLAATLIVSLAASLNAFWIARFDLNVATLIALTIALASVVPFSVLSRASSVSAGRWAPALFTSSTLPSIAVALAGGALAPSLREPANAFAVAVGASTIAALLLPSVALRRPPVSLQHGLRSLIRDPITIILFSATAIATSLTLFGSALDPRSRALGGNAGRWVAQVSLAEGATLVQTVGVVEELESRLSELEPVKRHWSWIDAGRARILIELQESARGRREREAARSRILRSLRGAGASVRLTATFGGSAQPDSWSDDIDDRASIDEEVRTYRMIVRGSEIESVRAAAARIRDRLSSIGFRGFAVHEETAPPSIRVDLVPFGSTRSEERAAVARALAAQSSLPSAIRLPGEPQRSVRVYTDRSPRDLDFVPQRQDLLNRPIAFAGGWIVPAMRYRTKDSLILPAFARQSGRFVVPISVAIHDRRIEERRTKRDKIDRNLAAMPLPAGVELDRPSASPWNVPIEKLRLFGIAAMLPLLLFAFAVIVLGSFAGAFDALVPLAGGVAVAAPLLWMNQTRVDELTLFALGAVAASTLPFAIMLLRRCEQRHVTKDAYRTFRNSAIPLVLAGIIVAGLLVGSTIGANAAEDAWASSLRSAGAAALASLSSMPFLSAALLLGRAAWHRRSHAETRERRNPPAWSDRRAGITLAARSLTKRYPNGLFALREISFELSPGIIGLLGPNGAGKTTLLRLMTGLLLPTRGQVLFRGAPVLPENLAEYRRHIGFLPQEFNAYPGFTAEEFLDYWALERGITDPKERAGEIELLLTAVGLEGEEKRKVRDFSGGMRQRIGIARALLGAPPVLIVDEPTTGLDIEARNRFRGLILSIAVHRIVILSTHIAGDVEATASRILLLHKGRLRFDGAPATLIERARGRVFETVLGDDDVRHFSERYRITARVRTLGGIRVRAVAAPDEAIEGAAVEPSLEEAYLAEIDRADVTRRGWRTRSRFSFLTEKDG